MDFCFDFSIFPTTFIPFGLDGWLFHAVPTAFIVWRERSGHRPVRLGYCVALILRLLGIYLLGAILVFTEAHLVFTQDPAAADSSPLIAHQPWPFIVIACFIHILAGILLGRILVRRLRDAGIAQRLGYLALLLLLNLVLYLGLLFYPPSRNAAPIEARA